ncbi:MULTISPECIES: DUF4233 domain-containing protein [unclassified Janibacter]|uniref:DUF4233 domain-containing protein n=1 Tax=unclassified Janibacter TaxID=2649294 RepID=UPI003CFED9F4
MFYGLQGKFTWRMLATILAGEGLVVFFGALVARGLGQVSEGGGTGGFAALCVLALACVVASGMMRRHPWGVTLGWILQALVIASGLIVPMLGLVGALFALVWVLSLRKTRQIDAATA